MYKQQRFHTQHHVSRTMFLLPALCSVTSINESAAIPRWPEDRRSESFSDEPVSPTVGCTGQVIKRNCRAVGLPNNTTSAKYSKLKKLFSGRNLVSAAAASLYPAVIAVSGGRGRAADTCEWPRRRVCAAAASSPTESTESSSCGGRSLDAIREMDPPLPVVKKVRKAAEEDGESLWKRRLGGAAADLKNLEIQQIHHHHHLQLCTRLDDRR